MNSVQMHLALTHVPVILSLVGLVMLTIAFFSKNTALTKTSYNILLIAGVSALPVYFSGEGAEEAVEHLPGISENLIEKHEDIAKLAMFSIVAAGALALTALLSFQWIRIAPVLKVLVFIFAISSGGLMIQAAHLGGQIRHSEINTNLAVNEGEERPQADD